MSTVRGHVVDGVVVLDDPGALPEGVQVEVLIRPTDEGNPTPLRGTPYRFDEPFAPAVDEADWDALQ